MEILDAVELQEKATELLVRRAVTHMGEDRSALDIRARLLADHIESGLALLAIEKGRATRIRTDDDSLSVQLKQGYWRVCIDEFPIRYNDDEGVWHFLVHARSGMVAMMVAELADAQRRKTIDPRSLQFNLDTFEVEARSC